MAKQAKRPSSVPGWSESVSSAKAERAKRQKTFEELSVVEKDELLKAIALRLGLIAPSKEEA